MTYSDIFAGYEARREHLREWAQRHYIDAFSLKPGRLLDAGCGDGFWAGLFADAGFEVRAFDNRPELIEDAIRKHPGIRFSVADVEVPLRSFGKFDVVFARTIPQFYQPALEPGIVVVDNLLRHVKADGLLLLSIFTDASGEDRPLVVGGTARHHTNDDLANMIARTTGTIRDMKRVSNYLQIGVTP